MHLLDIGLLFSPVSWIGAYDVLTVAGVIPHGGTRLGFLCQVFVVWIVLYCVRIYNEVARISSEDTSTTKKKGAGAAAVVVVKNSSWFRGASIALLLVGGVIVHDGLPVVRWMNFSLWNRYGADSDVYDVMKERMETGRIHRHRKYDLYVPPGICLPQRGWGGTKSQSSCRTVPEKKVKATGGSEGEDGQEDYSSSSMIGPVGATKNDEVIPSLIFLPGALVDHTSYAHVMAQLSDLGILVAVMSMEPLRRPWKRLGANEADVNDVIRHVKKRFEALRDGGAGVSSSPPPTLQWSIGGHSMGGYAAMVLSQTLCRKKLVLWAAGKFLSFVPDLSDLDGLEVLAIQASEDGIAKFGTKDEERQFRRRMPASSSSGLTMRVVSGGNHAGFASYDGKVPPDGKRKISREKQHQVVAEMTRAFLVS